MTQAAAARSHGVPPAQDGPGAEEIEARVAKHGAERGGLIAILEQIQSACGYLPELALRIVADRTHAALVDVYGIATFYRSFSLTPRGDHLISACLGTACHVRGAAKVVEEFERQLGIEAGETTADKQFTLETVNCLGACALGPVVVIDGHYFSKVRKPRVRQLLDEAAAGFDRPQTGEDARIFPIEVSCPRCNHSLMDSAFAIDDRPSIRVTIRSGGKALREPEQGPGAPTHGWLRLSSLYGSFHVATEHDVPPGTVVDFFCPHCHTALAGRSACPTCEAPMVPMMVQGGGIAQICSRRGCETHVLDLV